MNTSDMKIKFFIRKNTSFILLIAAFVAQFCFAGELFSEQKKVFRVSDRSEIKFEQMLKDLKSANLIFVGETHDREEHHRLQLDVVKELKESGVLLAVGFEMFTAENQNEIDQWVAGKLPLDDFIKVYYKNWNFPWPLYKDIFLYVRNHKIPSIGLNLPPEITRKVAKSGFSSLSDKEREKLPPEISCNVSEQYMRFIRRAYSIHQHGRRQFMHFCEAQLLWDQVMAHNLVNLLKKNPNRTVIVITGNGHAWKGGIPEQVKKLSKNINYKVLLPAVPGHIEPGNIKPSDADYILLQ